jgi:uncharacterized protein YcbK (DUF882 family)
MPAAAAAPPAGLAPPRHAAARRRRRARAPLGPRRARWRWRTPAHAASASTWCTRVDERYLPPALGADHFLRDHYSGEVGRMDPRCTTCCTACAQVLGTERRSRSSRATARRPPTSACAATRGGGVATRSLHMDGRAIDVRLPGVALADLRDAALSLPAGGVGYYPREQFVHLDTGRVRKLVASTAKSSSASPSRWPSSSPATSPASSLPGAPPSCWSAP